MIEIREANEEDNDALIELQRKCPMGTKLVLGSDSSPDYFACSKPFKDWHVLVAVEDRKMVGSAGFAMMDTYIGGRPCRTVYEYGFMVDPQHRRKGIATQLQNHVECFALQKNVDLLHLSVIEENVPSMNLFKKMGFELVKDCAVFSLMVCKRQKLVGDVAIKSVEKTHIEKVVSMINDMYHDYDFFHPFHSEDFMEYIKRIPCYGIRNIFVFEDSEDIKACLGYWDYNKVMKIIVQRLNWRLSFLSLTIKFMSLFTKMPVVPNPGETLRTYYLTTLAYKDKESLAELIRHIINIALENNVNFLSFPVDLESPIAAVLSRFIHVKVKLHVFIKPMKHKEFPSLREKKFYIDIVKP